MSPPELAHPPAEKQSPVPLAPLASPGPSAATTFAPQTLTGQAADDALKQSGQYASLGAAFQAARYAVEKIDPAGPHSRGAGYFAANPKQQLRAWFGKGGMELASGRRTPDGEQPWSLRVSLAGVGRAGCLPVGDASKSPKTGRAVKGTGSRVEIAHPDGVTEWYENRTDGIEQTFIVPRKPAGAGSLELLLAIEGTLRVEPLPREPSSGTDAVRFVAEQDAEVIRCSALKAWDATGRVLPARMEVRGRQLALLVADAGAQYPVTVDPLFANVEARLERESVAGDVFGGSVALSGDTALIGAYLDDTTAGLGAGSAYVFVRSGTIWSQQAKLTASDGAADDYFGGSVALSGDTALVGAYLDDSTAGLSAGSAYVFVRSGTIWSPQVKLTAGVDSSPEDRFGISVGLDGSTALVGAHFDDTAGDNAGSAYVFLLGELPAITQQPVSRTVVPGTSVTFSITATGYAPLSYQWRRNGFEIAGANDPSVTIQVPAQSPFAAVEGSYDCIVSNIGGVATSAPAVLAVDDLSEVSARPAPSLVADTDRQGFLTVNLLPSGVAGRGWRFVGELEWRAPGLPVAGLPSGDRIVEFSPVPGWQQPLPAFVSINSGAATMIDREYFLSGTSGATGSLTVFLLPPGLAGAQWRVHGDTTWRNSGERRDDLQPGSYLVECAPVAGKSTPPLLAVEVVESEEALATGTYRTAVEPVGTRPSLKSFDEINAPENAYLPYQHVGQLRSPTSSGTGFVVRRRVVATAADLVFDDGTLSDVTDLQWLFQRDRGIYEPNPQRPRGWFMLTGYSARREVEVPGESSPQSQNRDAAALFFTGLLAPDGSTLDEGVPGRDGYSGFLASNAVPNEWLTGNALKILVGYPTQGFTGVSPGRMHATTPLNVLFRQSFGQAYINDTADTTRRIYSGGGNSGGPLCVQFQDGNYYPAGIFVSGAGQSAVRAIDGELIALFDAADTAAGVGPQTGDGGISIPQSTLSAGSGVRALRVTIQPQEARDLLARWRLGHGGIPRASPYTESPILAPSATVYFNDLVSAFITPGRLITGQFAGYATNVALVSGKVTEFTATYYGILDQPDPVEATVGETREFVVRYSGVPQTIRWRRNEANLSNVTTPHGSVISGATTNRLRITNVRPEDAGTYSVSIGWPDSGSKTSSTAALTVHTSFQSWQTQFFTIAEQGGPFISGPTADPGRDGVNVLLAYALNLNPKTSDSRTMIPATGTLGLPSASRQNVGGQPRLSLEFVRRKASSTPGISYRVEFTSSLNNSASWSATGTETSVTSIDSKWERVIITDSQSATSGRFGRLVVTQS